MKKADHIDNQSLINAAELPNPSTENRLVWLSVFVFWTMIGAIAAVQEYIAIETRGAPVSFWRTLITNLPIYFWAVSTPLVFRAERRFPLGDRRKWGTVLPFHIIFSLLSAAAYLGLISLVTVALRDEPFSLSAVGDYFRYRFGRAFHVSVLTYWAILGFGFALDFYRQMKTSEVEAARAEQELETRLVQAKLDSLKMQIHPHFLFNTLNTISAIMSDDIKGARRVIARLSELLRLNLESSDRQTIALGKELELLNLYLDIERERFREKLAVSLHAPPETLDCQVPHFILQPLVENAVKHGIANQKEKGRINIDIRQSGNHLRIEIEDNGSGPPETSRRGIGLQNTRERLEKLYRGNYEFALKKSEKGGTRVCLTLPFQTDPGEDG
ncbi:MAG: histidine kinase [Pyrinomonadaceae bacterium]